MNRASLRWALGLGTLGLLGFLFLKLLPPGPGDIHGLAMETTPYESPEEPAASGAPAAAGVGLVSSVKGLRVHGEPQPKGMEPSPMRSFTVAIEAGKQGWPVPGARLTLGSPDEVVVEAVCDDHGMASMQWPATHLSIDDERLHWSVSSGEFGVQEVLPFDPEEPEPRLRVGAHLVVRGQLVSAYVDEWPYATVYLEPIGEGSEVPRYATCLAQKGGGVEMQLPLEQLRETMTFVVSDSFSAPLRRTIAPTSLSVDLGTIELSEGVVLRGVVEPRLETPFDCVHVTAYLDEYGENWTELPSRGGRVIDGTLCSVGDMVRVERDGSFVLRGLARRRYRVVAEAPGNLHFPGGRTEAMLTVDLRERSTTSPPLRLKPWWSTVHCQLRIPEGQVAPGRVLVHGTSGKWERQRGSVSVDPESGSLWFAVVSNLAQEARLEFPEGFEDVRIEIPALYPQHKHELDIVLTPDSKIRRDQVLQLSGPEGERISRVAGQEIAVRMLAYRKNESGLWEVVRNVELEPQGLDWVVKDLTRGPYRFQIFGMGYEDPDLALVAQQTDVEVHEDPLEPVHLQFTLGGRVHVRMVDPQGDPVLDDSVEVLLANGQAPMETYWKPWHPSDPGHCSLYQGCGRGSDTITSIPALPAGRYVVHSYKQLSDPRGKATEFLIRKGEVTEVTVLCK